MITATQTIHLGHSPDADDAFMFYALATGKIETGELAYEHVLQDIQTLNEWALEGRLETTALSVHAYAYVADRYGILSHGASMGEREYGPLVVIPWKKGRSSQKLGAPAAALESVEDAVRYLTGKRVAVPGKMTSAYLALRLCVSDFEAVCMPFKEVEQAVLQGEVAAGLLIHEGQLTHTRLGLRSILNLGNWWHTYSGGLPLPLGVNGVRLDLGASLQSTLSTHLKASVEYAVQHHEDALTYAMQYARGMDRALVDRFVRWYVNRRTVNMGPQGQQSIKLFLEEAFKRQLIPALPEIRFIQ